MIQWKNCPKCKLKVVGSEDIVEKYFGFRKYVSNRLKKPIENKVPQSYCRKCRYTKAIKNEINIFEGIPENIIQLIKGMVGTFKVSPLDFSYNLTTSELYYRGRLIK